MPSPPPIHLILGPEEQAKCAYIDTVTKALRAAYGDELERHHTYVFSDPPLHVISLLRNPSLFAPHILVIYEEVDTIKSAKEVQLLCSYIEKPSPNATLILTSSKYRIDSRIMKKIPKAQHHICWEYFDSKKKNLIYSIAKRYHVEMKHDAVELLIAHVAQDSLDLTKKVEQLCAFTAAQREGNRSITVEQVDNYLYHGHEETVFSLFDRIAQRALLDALESLSTLLHSNDEPSRIVGGLVWQLRQLHTLAHLVPQKGLAAACAQLSIVGKRRQKTYAAALQNFTRTEIGRIIDFSLTIETLMRIIGTAMRPELIHQYIYYVIVKSGRTPIDAASWYPWNQ